MAKKSKDAVEYVWLQCTETGDLNYRTPINVKGGIAEKLKAGMISPFEAYMKAIDKKRFKQYLPDDMKDLGNASGGDFEGATG